MALAAMLEALLAVAAAGGGRVPGAGSFILDGLSKVPWALLVCLGLWAALAAGPKRRLGIALVGLLVVPTASLAARSVLEVAHSLAFASSVAANPLAIAIVRGAEYAALGALLAWFAGHEETGAHHFAVAGLLIGLVFGGVMLALTQQAGLDSLNAPGLIAWGINELGFPLGCALIVFSQLDRAPLPAS
jgi:hypothetical protein